MNFVTVETTDRRRVAWFRSLTPEEQQDFSTAIRTELFHRELSALLGLPVDKVRGMSIEEWNAYMPELSNEQIQGMLDLFHKIWPSLKETNIEDKEEGGFDE
jgi:hypothetical protein